MSVLRALLQRILEERGSDPDVVLNLRTFEEWCRKAGFPGAEAGLDALRDEGAVSSYRIQSGRIKLFFAPREGAGGG